MVLRRDRSVWGAMTWKPERRSLPKTGGPPCDCILPLVLSPGGIPVPCKVKVWAELPGKPPTSPQGVHHQKEPPCVRAGAFDSFSQWEAIATSCESLCHINTVPCPAPHTQCGVAMLALELRSVSKIHILSAGQTSKGVRLLWNATRVHRHMQCCSHQNRSLIDQYRLPFRVWAIPLQAPGSLIGVSLGQALLHTYLILIVSSLFPSSFINTTSFSFLFLLSVVSLSTKSLCIRNVLVLLNFSYVVTTQKIRAWLLWDIFNFWYKC